MKLFKILLAFIMLSITTALFAQDAKMNYDETYFEHSGKEGDTVRSSGTWNYEVRKYSMDRVYASIYVDVDKQLGTPIDTFFLQSRKSPYELWSNRDTVIYRGTADTTFRLQATVRPYEDIYHRVYVKGAVTNGRIKINRLYGNFLQ
jgi:hypothetical protein